MKAPFIAVGVAIGATAHGAVVYTTGPGWLRESVGGGEYVQSIDMDGDGIRDFYTSSSPQLTLIATGINRTLASRAVLPDLGRSVVQLAGGELIGGTPTFGEFIGLEDRVNQFDRGGASIYYCSGRGPIGQPLECLFSIDVTIPVSYFGVEFQRNGETHYGWISVSFPIISTEHDIVVNGWAYDTAPNQAIIAGAIPEPSTAAYIGGSALLLWQRNSNTRKENKSAAANRWGLSCFIAWCRSKVQRVR